LAVLALIAIHLIRVGPPPEAVCLANLLGILLVSCPRPLPKHFTPLSFAHRILPLACAAKSVLLPPMLIALRSGELIPTDKLGLRFPTLEILDSTCLELGLLLLEHAFKFRA